MASLQLEISLHRDIIGKTLPIKEAILQEALLLNTALKSLLQRPDISGKDEVDVQKWIEQLEDIAKHAVTAPTTVGIIGATGSGKSSLMNAVFGSDLFPVSGTRACTAAITEISRNTGDAPYRAVIEINSEEAWLAELNLMREDTESAQDPDTEEE